MHQQVSYRMPPTRSPSLLNREALLGGLAGFAVLLGGAFAVPLAAIGAGVGALAGRQRMARESENGVIVRPPQLWNFGLAVGLAAGLVAAGLVAITLGFAGAGIGLIWGLAASETIGMAAASLGIVSTIAAGGYLGATTYEKRMQAEYVRAHEVGTVIDDTRPPHPLNKPTNAPEIPTLPSRAQGPAMLKSPGLPPKEFGDDAPTLRHFLDEEMKRRAMPKEQYPFNGR